MVPPTSAARYREPTPPALDQALLEELHDGLVCLSGCARHGIGARNPNAAARLARVFGRSGSTSSCSGRSNGAI
jgi:hypothetical protein